MLRRISKIKTEDYIEKVTGEKVTPGNITTAKQQFEILYRLYTNPDGNEYYDDTEFNNFRKELEEMFSTGCLVKIDNYILKVWCINTFSNSLYIKLL